MHTETKISIRKRILELLRSQKEEERIKNSRIILERLLAIPEFQQASTVLFYASFDGEVETSEMMQQAQKLRKKIALPTILRNHKKLVPSLVESLSEGLTEGPYGIKESHKDHFKPLDVKDIDLVLVPGIAFDRHNHRLGRGAGYYDRFLEALPSSTFTVGLAFNFQIIDRLPRQSHDVAVSRVITN